MKLGIRGHDIGIGEKEEIFSKIKQYSFNGVQLAIDKCLVDENKQFLIYNENNFQAIRKNLDKHQLEIAMLGAYFNPVHIDKNKIAKSIEKFKILIKYNKMLGCPYIGTETGSYNNDKWTYNELNHTSDALEDLVKIFKELVDYASIYNAYLTIEPAWNHVIYDQERLMTLINKLGGFENIRVTLDIYNLLNINNYHNYLKIFEDFVATFKDKIVIIHLKDFMIEDNKIKQVSLGEGMIDFKELFNVTQNYRIKPYFIFEGIVKENIEKSLNFIKEKI